MWDACIFLKVKKKYIHYVKENKWRILLEQQNPSTQECRILRNEVTQNTDHMDGLDMLWGCQQKERFTIFRRQAVKKRPPGWQVGFQNNFERDFVNLILNDRK